jgi:apolipoprotein D and lipocalin family protein
MPPATRAVLRRTRRHSAAVATFFVVCFASAGTIAVLSQERNAVQTVEQVNLDRYLGDWFEIARFPNRFQEKCAGDVQAGYARGADGRISVINRCRTADGGRTEARGVARVVDARTSAKLKVRFAPAALSFLPFVWGDYWILGLAADYSWAVVGSPDRKYLWILARAPVMDPQSYESALAAARANGFDLARLIKTTQRAPSAEARILEMP